jgi:mono/diheme cytochrome c family protein
VLARGKALYSVNCQFCHGAEARGGDGGGPNLLRSQLVLSDQNGELIAPVVRNGRPGPPPMPPMQMTDEQIADIATFVHSFRVGGYDITRVPPPTIVVGNAQAGEAAFRARCASCHSVTGDLRGFGAKFAEPRDLQQMWLLPAAGRGRGAAPSNVKPMSVTVTLASGQKFEGRLIRIDDFIVTLEQADGMPRSFGRNGDVPKVELNDPIKPHRELLAKYTDKEIHDITAYLVTLK